MWGGLGGVVVVDLVCVWGGAVLGGGSLRLVGQRTVCVCVCKGWGGGKGESASVGNGARRGVVIERRGCGVRGERRRCHCMMRRIGVRTGPHGG